MWVENSAPIFPSVHRSYKFALLTLGRDEPVAHFAFYLTEASQIAEPERNFSLSPQEIAAINPNTKTAPVFRTRHDASLTAKICSFGAALIDTTCKPERSPFEIIVIQNFFTSSNQSDAELFEKYLGHDSDGNLLPVKRGGSIWHYDHRFDAPEQIRLGAQDWRGTDRFVPKAEVANRHSPSGLPSDVKVA